VDRWIVVSDKAALKEMKRLPKEIVKILAQLRLDLESEGPTPRLASEA
jgi:hypothetical protein